MHDPMLEQVTRAKDAKRPTSGSFLYFLFSLIVGQGFGSDHLAAQGGQLPVREAVLLSFLDTSATGDHTNYSMAAIGDINLDGVPDMALGLPNADGGRGRLAVLFLDTNGSALSSLLLGAESAGLLGLLDTLDGFGTQVIGLGDLDNDSVPDLAALSPGDDDSGTNAGCVHILFLTREGTIKSSRKIASGQSGYTGLQGIGSGMRSLANAQDLNGDGTNDLLIGSPRWMVNNTNSGAVKAALLASNGMVLGEWSYTATTLWPGSNPIANLNTLFGCAVAGMGDIDGDGHGDIAVTAGSIGKIFTIKLQPNGAIKAWRSLNIQQFSDKPISPAFGSQLALGKDLDHDGTNELMCWDPTDTTSGLDFGRLYFWEPKDLSGENDAIKCWVLGADDPTDQGPLPISSGESLAPAFQVLGDLDGDGVPELAAGINNGQSSVELRILILYLKPTPLAFEFSAKDQTPDSLGSMRMAVSGGTPPYQYFWSEDLVDPTRFDDIKNTLDTAGLGGLGMRPPLQTGFSKEEFEAMIQPRFNNLKAGIYDVSVKDIKGEEKKASFAIGVQVNTLVEVGATTSEDNKDLRKTASNGWSNMQLRTKNVLPKGEDGWVRFSLPEVGKQIAVGLKNVDVPDQAGYTHLMYAYFFDLDSVKIWNGSGIQDLATPYNRGDVFQLAREKGMMVFQINDSVIHTIKDIDIGKALSIQVAVYDQYGKVSDVTTNFRSTFSIAPTVTHAQPLSPVSGAIGLDLPAAFGPYNYTWSVAGRTGPSLVEVEPGEYIATVSSPFFDHTVAAKFRVGQKFVWNGTQLGDSLSGIGRTISYPNDSVIEWGQHLLSKNLVRSGSGHYLAFKPYPLDVTDYGALVGLRSSTDQRLWAGWWVYGLGRSMIAQTVSRNGTIHRTLLERNDELEVYLHPYSIHFLKNGELVHQVARGTEENSHVLVALHSSGSTIRNLSTSIPLPLELNTSLLEAGTNFVARTPDGVVTAGKSGERTTMELGPTHTTARWQLEAPATDSTAAATLSFLLTGGEPTDLRMGTGQGTTAVDSMFYEFREPNQLIIYDDHERLAEVVPLPFEITIEDRILMTPNGDGQFDGLAFTGIPTTNSFDLKVRDRTDNLLFQTTDRSLAWNGKFMNTGSLVARGTYNYELTLGTTTYNGRFMINY